MWYNPIMRSLIRSPLHFFVSKNMMLMTYTGRKSGKPYTTPMNYLRIGDTFYTVSSREHVWWRNLRGGADVTLRLRGRDVPASAETLEDPGAAADALTLYLQTAPQLGRYMKVRIGPDGAPDAQDINNLAGEMVVVRAKPK